MGSPNVNRHLDCPQAAELELRDGQRLFWPHQPHDTRLFLFLNMVVIKPSRVDGGWWQITATPGFFRLNMVVISPQELQQTAVQ